MRRVQAAALTLFEEHGFEAVTVEAIARAAGVGPATVYRNFETKERIILWDDYDADLLSRIRAALPSPTPLDAVRDALITAVADVYSEDRDRILRRTRLLLAHPEIGDRARSDQALLANHLIEVFTAKRTFGDALGRMVAARAIVGALESAVVAWARSSGKTSLAHWLRRAFAKLASLGAAPRQSTIVR
ncbi:MAG: helix-turn-helix domain-containing protein [Polyangiaceae bacterium]